jgi:hypothetical protein
MHYFHWIAKAPCLVHVLNCVDNMACLRMTWVF